MTAPLSVVRRAPVNARTAILATLRCLDCFAFTAFLLLAVLPAQNRAELRLSTSAILDENVIA